MLIAQLINGLTQGSIYALIAMATPAGLFLVRGWMLRGFGARRKD